MRGYNAGVCSFICSAVRESNLRNILSSVERRKGLIGSLTSFSLSLLGLGSHETGERNEGHPLDCVAVVSGSEHRDGERKAKGRRKEGV